MTSRAPPPAIERPLPFTLFLPCANSAAHFFVRNSAPCIGVSQTPLNNEMECKLSDQLLGGTILPLSGQQSLKFEFCSGHRPCLEIAAVGHRVPLPLPGTERLDGTARRDRPPRSADDCCRVRSLRLLCAVFLCILVATTSTGRKAMPNQSIATLRQQALDLPEADRAELARDLVASLDGPADSDVADAWDKEILRRLAEIDAGTAELIDRVELTRRLQQRPQRA